MIAGCGRSLFVTGTDTEVGKTHVSCGLLRAARSRGLDICGFKPVASGARRTATGLRNADALALMKAADTREPYDAVNPYVFAPAIAPHLAATQARQVIRASRLDRALSSLESRHDWVLVEGAGGWHVPLGPEWRLSDWVSDRDLPVVLVVGMRLGCINHALLSAESIARTGRLVGWIANELPPRQPLCDENVSTLLKWMPAPLLGRVRARQRDMSDIWDRLVDVLSTARR